MRTWGKALAVAIACGALVITAAAPASAVPAGTIGSFPTWTMSGSANSFTGTASFTNPTDANATVSTDSVSLAAPTGESAYLGASTAFGQEFGSTRKQPYLTLRARSAAPAPTPPSTSTPPPSTTTVMFSTAPTAGWGFAVGDIDADWVFIQPLDAAGNPLPTSDLGEQGAGNYCENASPKPSACTGATAPYDVPNWVPGPSSQTVSYGASSITYTPGTVYGNVNDTAGAYVWFMPSTAVRGIRLLYGALSGSPNYQLWLAQPAPATTITGQIALGGAAAAQPVPPGTSVELQSADGTPVQAIDDAPVTVPVNSDGTYEIVTEQRDEYQIAVLPPVGYEAPAPIVVPALAAEITAPEIVMAPVPTSPATVTSSSPAAASGSSTTATSGELADSGSNAIDGILAACALVAAGLLLFAARARAPKPQSPVRRSSSSR
ncbi:MAG: hypothetical protein ACTHON_07475 [Humibacter sp.]